MPKECHDSCIAIAHDLLTEGFKAVIHVTLQILVLL